MKYFNKCLESEKQLPFVRTSVNTDFSIFIAQNRLEQFYDKALEILEEQKESQMLITIDELFVYHAVRAMVFSERGKIVESVEESKKALDQANIYKSQYSRHPNFGLVNSSVRGGIIEELTKIINEGKVEF